MADLMAIDDQASWREARQYLSDYDARTKELQMMMQTGNIALDSSKAELDRVLSETRAVESQMAQSEAFKVKGIEEQRLLERQDKAEDALAATLSAQLRLLRNAEAQQNLNKQRAELGAQLGAQKSRLNSYRRAVSAASP